jgi:hypothetical protein
MINKDPLMVDAEVTIRFVLPNFCWYSDIEGNEQQLKELVEQELQENGFLNFTFEDTDFELVDAKIIL